MAVVKDRPLSEAQEFALSALSQHGFIVRTVGSFLRVPHGCQVPQRTIDSLAKRGYGKKGVVRQGDLELDALLSPAVASPVIVGNPKPVEKVDPIVSLKRSDVELLVTLAMCGAEWREIAGHSVGLSEGESKLFTSVTRQTGVARPKYNPILEA
jgi:hypothetical protein